MDYGALPPEINSARMFPAGLAADAGGGGGMGWAGRGAEFDGILVPVSDRAACRRRLAGAGLCINGGRGDPVHDMDQPHRGAG